jgi:hypothetical protein
VENKEAVRGMSLRQAVGDLLFAVAVKRGCRLPKREQSAAIKWNAGCFHLRPDAFSIYT